MLTRDKLHVVGAYSNYNRYAVRARLTREWLGNVLDSGARITLIEVALGERAYEFEEYSHIRHIKIRGGPQHELWLQHALYNRAFASLPDDAQYICWEDTDIKHLRGDWVMETLHMLQQHRVGQTWTHSIDLGPNGEIVPNEWDNSVDRSFSAAFHAGEVSSASGQYAPNTPRALLPPKKDKDHRSHTGYSGAIRKTALDGIGRLVDWQIIGCGDYTMAHGFAGTLPALADQAERDGYAPGYVRKLRHFAELCDRYIQQDIGVGTRHHRPRLARQQEAPLLRLPRRHHKGIEV